MSLNVPPIPVSAVLDPRLQIKEHEYVALKGAAVSSWVVFPANNVSNSSVSVVCNPPSREMAISRLVFQRAQFDISVSGTNATAGPLLVSGAYGPRAMPLAMVTNAFQVTINNVTVTQSPLQQYWGALMWLGDNDQKNRFGQYSMTASMLDQTQSYSDSFQTNRNPLAPYTDNSFENTRGGFVGFQVISNPNAGTTATLRLTVVEPILVSPLVSGHSSNFTSCLSGVQNMSVQLNFGDLTRLLSINNTIPGINIDANQIIVTNPQYSLIFQYFTPDPLYRMPSSIQASYFNITPYLSNQMSAPAGQTISIPFNSIQVSSIPRRLIIFARQRDQDRTVFTSDTYLALPRYTNPLSLTWDNNQFLSQATTEDLYNMAVKNGCQMSYSQYTNHVGSIIILDAGIDFGLPPQDAPGVLKNVQLGLTCNFTNTSSVDLTVQMFVIAVYEGTLNINNGDANLMLAPLSHQDILNAKESPHLTYKQQTDVYGGNFFNSLRRAFRSVHDYAKSNQLASKMLGAIPHPATQVASRGVRALGYGRSGGNGNSGGRARHMRGGQLEDENINEISEESDSDERNDTRNKISNKQKLIDRLTSKKINKISNLADDY